MAAPSEFTLESVRDFILLNGGRVTNHDLVKHFKIFLTDPSSKGKTISISALVSLPFNPSLPFFSGNLFYFFPVVDKQNNLSKLELDAFIYFITSCAGVLREVWFPSLIACRCSVSRFRSLRRSGSLLVPLFATLRVCVSIRKLLFVRVGGDHTQSEENDAEADWVKSESLSFLSLFCGTKAEQSSIPFSDAAQRPTFKRSSKLCI